MCHLKSGIDFSYLTATASIFGSITVKFVLLVSTKLCRRVLMEKNITHTQTPIALLVIRIAPRYAAVKDKKTITQKGK